MPRSWRQLRLREGPLRRGVWTRRSAEGPQSLYYRVRVGRSMGIYPVLPEPAPPTPEPPDLAEPLRGSIISIICVVSFLLIL